MTDEPVQFDSRKLRAFLGEEPHTPLDEAVSTTLKIFNITAA